MQMDESLREPIHKRIVISMNTFADRLDELIQAHPLYKGTRGQSLLSRKTGVPQPTISRILKSANAPEMKTVVPLALEFGVACEWLLTGRGPKYLVEAKQGKASLEAEETNQIEQSLQNQLIHEIFENLKKTDDQGIDAILSFAKAMVALYPKFLPLKQFDLRKTKVRQTLHKKAG